MADDERVTGGGALERVPEGSPEMANTAPAEEGPEAAQEAAASHAATADSHKTDDDEPLVVLDPDAETPSAPSADDTTTGE